MSDKYKEIYERYLTGETDFRKLGNDYGVTRERIRQVVEKMDKAAHPLREPISRISAFRSQLEEASQKLVGKVDSDTISQYNNLVTEFDRFVERLKQIDDGKAAAKPETDSDSPDLYRQISEYKMSKELKTATANTLMRSGINNLKDLTYATLGQLKAINRMGKSGFDELKEFAESKHIVLGSNSDKKPIFRPGDVVRCMSSRTPIKCGAIVTVQGEHPAYGRGYRHPTYRVTGDKIDKHSFCTLSVGEMEKI